MGYKKWGIAKSGKAVDFDSMIQRFKSSYPRKSEWKSHLKKKRAKKISDNSVKVARKFWELLAAVRFCFVRKKGLLV